MARGNNSADDLQDLVTGILAPNSEEEEAEERQAEQAPLLERASASRNLGSLEIISRGRSLEEFLQDVDWEDSTQIRDRVSEWSTAIVGLGYQGQNGRLSVRRTGLSPYGEMLFMMIEYLRNPSQEGIGEMYRYCRAFNNGLELSTIQGDIDSSVSYLQERWGDDSSERLHELTGTSKATTKKWLQGSFPASGNQNRIKMAVELLFSIETGCRKSWPEVEQWVNSPNPSLAGNSPWQHLVQSNSSWSMPNDLRSLLREEIERAG